MTVPAYTVSSGQTSSGVGTPTTGTAGTAASGWHIVPPDNTGDIAAATV